LDKVSNELKKEGFGILTQINVTEKFKEKLDIDFKKYIKRVHVTRQALSKLFLLRKISG
jgi:hypothetical protein